MREDLILHPSWLCVPGGSSNYNGFWGRCSSRRVPLFRTAPPCAPTLLQLVPLPLPLRPPGAWLLPLLQWQFSIGLCRAKV